MRALDRLMDDSVGNNIAADSYKFDRLRWYRNECPYRDRRHRDRLGVDRRGIPDHMCIRNHLEFLGI